MREIIERKISQEEKKDIIQPYKKKLGVTGINEDLMKVYGADKHPDPEVRAYYIKKGWKCSDVASKPINEDND